MTILELVLGIVLGIAGLFLIGWINKKSNPWK